jgi:hypothetical protein
VPKLPDPYKRGELKPTSRSPQVKLEEVNDALTAMEFGEVRGRRSSSRSCLCATTDGQKRSAAGVGRTTALGAFT